MPVLLDGLGDHAPGGVMVVHVVVAGDSGAAPFADQLDGEVGCLLIGAVAGDRRAEVVDDDAGAMAGQLQRVGSPDAVPRAGDDRDLSLKYYHGEILLRRGG